MGLAAEASAMDPHFHNLGPNHSMTKHIFDRIVDQDENQRLKPMLAASWRPIDETTWEFKLRSGVKFSDGSDFTANDVIYTYCRIPKVENSPSSMAINVRAIVAMTAPDPLTLHIKTASPHPLLPNEISNLGILSAKLNGAGAVTFDRQECKGVGTFPKTEAFNAGQAAIGTGPYKLARFTKGDRLILERNDAYWGEKPAWQRIIFRPITSAGPRVAALLSGDVDLIENVPIQDLNRVKQNADFKVVQGLSNRVIYLHFNYLDDTPPGVDAGGKNPFRDKRVRAAISKAIDRDAIVARIMGGVAVPAGELLPGVMFGANKEMTRPEGRRGRRQEAARRGRLSERLHPRALDAERPLHQRRADLAGRRADAHAHRPEGVDRRHDPEHVLRQAQQARVRLLARRLGLRHRRDVVAAQGAGVDAEQGHRHGRDQSGRLLQPQVGCDRAEGARDRGRRRSAPSCWRRAAAPRWMISPPSRCISR